MAARQKKDASAAKPPARRQTAGKGHGWNKFIPTDADRQMVMLAAAVGMPHDRIAKQVRFPDGITAKTLREHFAAELDTGSDRANLTVAGSLFRTANDRAHKGHPVAAIFWMKTRARWSEQGPLAAVTAEFETDKANGGLRRFTLKIGEREPDDEAGGGNGG